MHIFWVIILDLLLIYFFFGNSILNWILPKNLSARRNLKQLRNAVRQRFRREQDILSSKDRETYNNALSTIDAALATGTPQEQLKLVGELEKDKYLPPRAQRPWKWWLANNLEILVVSIGVAFGIRALFIQPFKIPTGSMQPTLYGIHHNPDAKRTNLPGIAGAAFDYLNYSRRYIDATAPADLTLNLNRIEPLPSKPLFPRTAIGYVENGTGRTGAIVFPADVNNTRKALMENFSQRFMAGYTTFGEPVASFKKGDVIMSGAMESGDHLFVNRLSLCFKEPYRGQVMVFHTRGITYAGQPLAGDYYIKRLVGLPGDTLKIQDRKMWVRPEGAKEFTLLDGPGFDKLYSNQNGYCGYSAIPGSAYLKQEGEEFTVPPRCYFLLGDNTNNSLDSRFWGVVPRENLMGSPCVVWWPFSTHFGFVDR